MVAILNSAGTAVATYSYEAWGGLLSYDGTMGSLNPLRYRGYVYDEETGLYYLQSRYYDPGKGRFINGDALIATGQGLLGNNMFAYCGNNPVMFIDPTGAIPFSDGFFDESFRETGRWIYEALTGREHPDRQAQRKNEEIIVKQNEIIGNAFSSLWDAYVLSIELQVEQQYQRDMAIKEQWEDIFRSPARTGDFVAMTVSNVSTYATYVSFALTPTLAGGIGLLVALGGSIWSTLRYYDIILE